MPLVTRRDDQENDHDDRDDRKCQNHREDVLEDPVLACYPLPVFQRRPGPGRTIAGGEHRANRVLDGPGQGESNTRETWVTLDNFERAGKAAIDFIENIPELDASKVGVYGWSMGSYWGPRVAAFDPRVRALVGAMGNYLQKDTIFKHSKPAYRANYMYMSNTHEEDAFDAMAAQMTLEPLAGKIKCPTLLAMGEYDELCPLADGERANDADLTSFASLAGCPAISLPMGTLPDGLPAGLQLIGAPGSDLRLLELAEICAATLDAAPKYPVGG